MVKEKLVKRMWRWYQTTLSDRSQVVEVHKMATEGLKNVDKSKLPGKFKIWCLQFGLYPRLIWPLTMYEVALSRMEIIEKKCGAYTQK